MTILISIIIVIVIGLLAYNWYTDSTGETRLIKSLIDVQLELFGGVKGELYLDLIRRYYDAGQLQYRFGMYTTFEPGKDMVGVTRVFRKDGVDITETLRRQYKKTVNDLADREGWSIIN